MNSTTSTRVTWLYDPDVSSWIALLQLLIVAQQISILVRQDISVRIKVECVPPKLLLHLDVVKAASILSSDLIWVWEMIDPLKLIESFIQISFAAATGPKKIPLMRLSVSKVIGFTKTSYKFRVTFQYFVKELAIIDVISTLVAVAISRCWWRVHK